MDEKKLTGGRCPHCGGVEVAAEVMVHQNAEVNRIGIAYKAMIFNTVEQLYADLCLNCGRVVSFYVKEPKRNWIQKDSGQ